MTDHAGSGPGSLRRRVREWLTRDDPPRLGPGRGSAPARRMAQDALLAAAVALLAVPQVVFHATTDSADLPGVVLFSLLLVVPLGWRRSRPLATLAVVGVVAAGQWLAGVPLAADVAVLISLYTVARSYPLRTALLAGGVVEVGALLAAVRWPHGLHWSEMFLVLSAFVVATVMSGGYVRDRQRLVAALRQQTDQLRRERDQQAAIAAATERARIARELHDIMSHSVAVMITLAEAAALRAPADPERAASAMRQVASTGRGAMVEARTVLGVLRAGPDADRSPQPGLADLPGLAAAAGRTGIAVRAGVTGDLEAVSPGLGVTVYRIAQEALTNALRHAADLSDVTIAVTIEGDALTLVVDDDGRPPAGRSGGGYGLRGMLERAAAFDGSIHAGPRPGRGWRVTACFPLPQPTPEPSVPR